MTEKEQYLFDTILKSLIKLEDEMNKLKSFPALKKEYREGFKAGVTNSIKVVDVVYQFAKEQEKYNFNTFRELLERRGKE